MEQEFKKILLEMIKNFPEDQQKILIDIFESSNQNIEKLISNANKKNEN